MENTLLLKRFATEEQILECLILFETRKMEAAKQLAFYMYPKWQVSTIEAVNLLLNIQKEWENKK